MGKQLTENQQKIVQMFSDYKKCRILVIQNHKGESVFYIAQVWDNSDKVDYLDLSTKTVNSLHKRGVLHFTDSDVLELNQVSQ